MLKWQSAGGQIRGARRQQEDRWAICPWRRGLIAVVADGMGGHQGGDIASDVAITAFTREVAVLDQAAPLTLNRGLAAAIAGLLERIRLQPALADMGCTLVAVAIEQDHLNWISVGDSPLWLVEEGQGRRLNADHSMRSVLAEMIRDGRITAEAAARHPTRNALRSVLCRDPPPLIDRGEYHCRPDRNTCIVLGSDGLDSLDDRRLARLAVEANTVDSAVDIILAEVEAAEVRGQDNATVIVARPSTV